MKAVVLAGGRGTRLRPLSLERPKPLVPIHGRAILDWIIDSLPGYFDEVLLACNYMKDEINRYYGGRDVGVEVRVVDEPRPLGTGGAIKNMEPYIDGDFVVFNGDILSSIDVDGLVGYHRSKGGVGAIALWGVENPGRYGIVGLDGDGRINRFVEKPSPDEVFSNLINAGIYVFDQEVFGYMERGRKTSVEREVFPRLVDDLYGYRFDGYWVDIGTPSSYIDAHQILDSDRERSNMIRGSVEGSYLYDGVVVEEDVVVENSVLLEGVELKEGSRVCNSVVGSGSIIMDSVVEGSVVGDGCKVSGVCVCDGVRVWNGVDLSRDGFEVM
ncbi:N-acetylglucosamine-1-phosphate uridyltransferase [Methanonatronarchaeum thermophilum]|uniref:Bifunctional protein GlmU n=1 Tax=Methanonatronarchaeum thermophilum TaxID=1927129 RepID=A0A1Y3GDD8_9EURY|nr:NDP-sugar synthase [Methanonatronarchaeum thermophilum]OUJ19260.1 N-acetylglucosamine-1-phosphate uridyltransferase [Methanonatronarchaeum thermophilum]